MRITRLLMGMPVTVEVVGTADTTVHEAVFGYFDNVDRRFSPFRADSEVAAINDGRIGENAWSEEMRTVMAIA